MQKIKLTAIVFYFRLNPKIVSIKRSNVKINTSLERFELFPEEFKYFSFSITVSLFQNFLGILLLREWNSSIYKVTLCKKDK